MPREPIPVHCFAVVVVRQRDLFLLVEERDPPCWFYPAGRVEPGETFAEAALRETLEESGIPVELEGILRVEHTPRAAWARLRVVFLAHPTGDTPPKSHADEHSLQARWGKRCQGKRCQERMALS
jgi:8-oxo-dGTP pyrophosphatase MutT (NUDIX family)